MKMKVIKYMDVYRVIDIDTNKVLYQSFSKIDCEQWKYGKIMMMLERRKNYV